MIPKIPNIMDVLTCSQYMQCITFYSILISMPSGWVYATNIKHIVFYKYCRLIKICRKVEFYLLEVITNISFMISINKEKAIFVYYNLSYIIHGETLSGSTTEDMVQELCNIV